MEGREYCLAFSLLFSLSVYFCCFSTLYFYCILFIFILCFSTAAGLLQQTNFSNGGLIIKLYRIVSYITSDGIGTQDEYPPPTHTHTHTALSGWRGKHSRLSSSLQEGINLAPRLLPLIGRRVGFSFTCCSTSFL